LKASISWLLTKAYGQDIPPDYRQMFYEDDKVGRGESVDSGGHHIWQEELG